MADHNFAIDSNAIVEAAKKLLAAAEQDYGHNPYCRIFWRESAENGYKDEYCSCKYGRIAEAARNLRAIIDKVK